MMVLVQFHHQTGMLVYLHSRHSKKIGPDFRSFLELSPRLSELRQSALVLPARFKNIVTAQL